MHDYEKLHENLVKYVDNITQIRVLSAVVTDGIESADDYSKRLREDYKRIGELGVECRAILDENLYPILRSDDLLEEETLRVLQNFCHMLLEPVTGEELDLSLLFEVSNRILNDFKANNDDNGFVRQAHIHVNVCYANVNRTARVTSSPEMCTYYRDEGLKATEAIKEYYNDESLFLKLDNEARKSVMSVLRFYSALYDTFYYTEPTNEARFQALVDAIAMYDNTFLRSNINDYNWELHKYRCIEHMGQLTERGNRWGFDQEKCKVIYDWLLVFEEFAKQSPEKANEITPDSHLKLELLRNAYFAGVIEKKAYQEGLLKLYDEFGNDRYDMHSVQMNLLIPAEYMYTIRNDRISARIERRLETIYDRVIDYILNSVNRDAFNYLQEYLMAFLDVFIELPGKMSFLDMGLYCLAALHPPTYVHSRQVADISKCLAECLIEEKPELFADELGCDTETVLENRASIISHIYNNALCHDFGKLTMIDSIFVYGRNLLDSEFNIIKKHTVVGAKLLSSYDSTKQFQDVAMQHHLWFDEQGGYNVEYKATTTVSRCIVEVADCIDAATDSIGRSYNRGKDYYAVKEEIMAGSGSRYAPYIAQLLDDEDITEDIEYLLGEGREAAYKQTFLLLTGVKSRLDSQSYI